MGKSVARLFEQFQPANYGLELELDPKNMTFQGSVMIRGKKVGRPSGRLTFHQKDLKITAASIIKHDKKGDQALSVKRINNQNSLDEVRLHVDGKVFPGGYTIKMDFEGKITRPMNGIYPCFFKHDGQDKKLIATQFESHHAREAFPCVDEPEAKATFDLTLITPEKETVLSNTPIKKQTAKDALFCTEFDTTPKMSTYLLAFVYGDMGYREGKTKHGVIVRSYATPNNVKLTEYSVDIAVRCLEFFEDYFALPYPLPKLDMVALPDFSSGAMENWGLVTYRESVMLADTSTSIETRQDIARVICHELSHQWFGNLVTMKWWDDLWLNESFANMMEYRAMDELFPEWKVWELLIINETVGAKRRDSLGDVQSVHSEVNHPDEISTLFDPSIVYAKGGSILYMLMHYLGEDVFQAGLQAYFKNHAYGNTQADDLWVELSNTSGKDVGTFMKKWLSSPGYPLISVDWTPGSDTLMLNQQRFLSDPNAISDDSEPWYVPLATTLPLNETIFKQRQSKLRLKDTASDKPLLFNHEGQSYSLPYYQQPAHLQQIVAGIKHNQVSTIDRLLLLDNYLLLQRGGISPTTELLDLLSSYQDETSENVWGAMAMAIGEARKLTEYDEKCESQLDRLVGRLSVNMAESLGWDDHLADSAQTLRLRGLAISMAAGAKVQTIIDEGLRRFDTFTKPSVLNASTRSIVYFCGVRYGTPADFDKLLSLYKTVQSADEKDEIASGLTSAKHKKQYEQLLGLLKTETIRRQDLMHWYVWLLRNRFSRPAAWDWLQENWDWLMREFSSDKSFGYFPRYAGSIFSTEKELAQFSNFFGSKKSIVAISRDVTLAEQEITSRVAWRKRNETAVKKWLAKL